MLISKQARSSAKWFFRCSIFASELRYPRIAREKGKQRTWQAGKHIFRYGSSSGESSEDCAASGITGTRAGFSILILTRFRFPCAFRLRKSAECQENGLTDH